MSEIHLFRLFVCLSCFPNGVCFVSLSLTKGVFRKYPASINIDCIVFCSLYDVCVWGFNFTNQEELVTQA